MIGNVFSNGNSAAAFLPLRNAKERRSDIPSAFHLSRFSVYRFSSKMRRRTPYRELERFFGYAGNCSFPKKEKERGEK